MSLSDKCRVTGGMVLKIRTHPNKGKGGLKICDFGGRPK